MTTSPSISTVLSQLDAAIARHDLLQHPFYVAWSMGTLPQAALRDYAGEYGAFIATISQGWRTAGEEKIARIEEGHTRVWQGSFATSLGTAVGAPQNAEVARLVALSGSLFSDPVTALGGLYAFEAQQPYTAQSKLKGLREHYADLPERCGDYFRLHETDYAEPAMLAEKIAALEPADRARALEACGKMSQALYDALTGIYAPYAA
jgi:pyrroloquinoline-quinone synthase